MTSEVSPGKARPTARRRLGFWILCAAPVLALAAAGALGLHWWPRRPAPVDPPLPADIQDAEVRMEIDRARQKVLDKPQSADAWGQLGMTLLANLFDAQADRRFAEAARLAPGDAQWPYARGLIASKRDPERALPLLRQAVASSNSWKDAGPGLRMKLAETLQARQDLDEAEALFREELGRTPGDPRATFGLGLIAVARGHDKAAEEYLGAVKNNPNARQKVAAQLSALAAARGDVKAAADYEKQSVALPDDAPWPDPLLNPLLEYSVGHRYWERKVTELEHQGRWTEAAEICLQQIERNPNPRAYIQAGGDFGWANDYKKALPLLREGLRLDPDSSYGHYTLAVVQFTRAIKELQQSPNSPEAKAWLAEVVEHARRTTELKPDHNRAFFYLGLSLKLLGEPNKAVEALRQGVACHPEVYDLQVTLGETYLDLEQYRDAEIYLENARLLEPQDPRLAKDFERLRNKKK